MKRYLFLGFWVLLLIVGAVFLFQSCADDKRSEEEILDHINIEAEPEFFEDDERIWIDNSEKEEYPDEIEDAGDEPFTGGGDAGDSPAE